MFRRWVITVWVDRYNLSAISRFVMPFTTQMTISFSLLLSVCWSSFSPSSDGTSSVLRRSNLFSTHRHYRILISDRHRSEAETGRLHYIEGQNISYPGSRIRLSDVVGWSFPEWKDLRSGCPAYKCVSPLSDSLLLLFRISGYGIQVSVSVVFPVRTGWWRMIRLSLF